MDVGRSCRCDPSFSRVLPFGDAYACGLGRTILQMPQPPWLGSVAVFSWLVWSPLAAPRGPDRETANRRSLVH
eukprot:7749266-Pyramimonas_sp.AAC.1